ncbi:hypothetical protein CS912_22990 [Klebsiella variicola]|uniref:hypothetical protein n=1 Tax=Klebsiella variicola TaxID=244366 RepID=UPI000C558D78|nr:hypothetical protein [Klebsiella variicola]PHZ92133.1 hypothetical protein CS911_26615 [Klebsiella variicola]PHZ92619.1 hypothetical protein CS911_26565 [Klebsiella variicola]PIA08510.1 hypothetical protein CS912_22990 [Klebsiella variicola]
MSFKMTKTFNATMTGDNGLAMGIQQIEAEVIYTITLIQVIDEGTAHATINASVNGQTPTQADVFQFPYTMNGTGLFAQAETAILASEKYAGGIVI